MRGPPMLEAEARTAVRPACPFGVGDPQEHFLSFLEIAAHDLREVAVRDADLHGDGCGLPRRTRDEDTARERALPRQLGIRQLRVVLRPLLRRENGADLLARGLTDPRGLDAALAVADAARGQVAHLLARVLENGLDLALLLGVQAERLRESIANLLGRLGRPAAR